jgi:glycosyltransferase involved in cell wall biosynthesis
MDRFAERQANQRVFMASQLEISVILTTYQRPEHLERSLVSLDRQRGMNGKYEVVVSDDGSADRTKSVVEAFARKASFPLIWTSHLHSGFRVALCRNDGVRVSSAPYLLFTDSDCLFPEDHLQKHVLARRPGIIRAGDCYRMEQDATERIDAAAIICGAYQTWISLDERRRIYRKRIKERFYQLVRHPTKPKLTGFNIGISREDLEAVNGFDESFVGWGCEDDDLAFRLRKSGRRIASLLSYTHGYHMWHPSAPSRPERWADGPNVGRLQYERPIRCAMGLVSTSITVEAQPRITQGSTVQQTVHQKKRRAA